VASKSVINVKILGDNKGLKASLDDSSNKIGNFVKKAGKSAATVGIALGVAAVKGIAAFASFEKSMNEVFTLLPGISAEAMDAMSGQVKDFSKKFGVLPEETIPALYQALSAGVPEGNVFDFLEVAQQAAKGGVTELATAVDGISSVVNAYGDEIISAAEASDLMFTTVRLGKTTFEEISASISNITPISSALGVGFDEVSAALAVLTSKGVPTAKSTTQIKSALAELGKEGTIADKAFQAMTGGGFQDFIDQGGSMGEAFQIIADGAEASDKSVLDMFGSVEAGQAVLALTANGGEAFTDVMGEMAGSAGATEDAFNTMDGGLASAFDKIKANFSVILIEIGEKLAPTIQKATDWITENSERISASFDRAMVFLGAAIAIGVRAVTWLVETVRKYWPTIQTTIESFVVWFQTNALPIIKNVVAFIVATFDEIKAWVDENWPAIKETIEGVIEAIRVVIERVTTVITAIWETHGERFVAYAVSVWDKLKAIIGAAIDIVRGIINTVTSLIRGDWSGVWEGIKTILSGVWDAIKGIVGIAIDAVKLLIVLGLDAIKVAWFAVWGAIATFADDQWESIKGFASSGIDAVVGFVTSLPGRIASGVAGAFDSIYDGFKAVINRVIEAWNGLSLPGFTIGGWDPPGPGPSFPSITIPSVGTPNIPRLASGGLAFEPMLAVVGDNPGARLDPEVIAPSSMIAKIVRAELDGGSSRGGAAVVINLMDRFQVEAVVSQRDADLLMSLEAGMR